MLKHAFLVRWHREGRTVTPMLGEIARYHSSARRVNRKAQP